MCVEKCYIYDDIFKMNVMTVVPSVINNNISFSYLLESLNLWHGRLGRVNYGSLRRLINMES